MHLRLGILCSHSTSASWRAFMALGTLHSSHSVLRRLCSQSLNEPFGRPLPTFAFSGSQPSPPASFASPSLFRFFVSPAPAADSGGRGGCSAAFAVLPFRRPPFTPPPTPPGELDAGPAGRPPSAKSFGCRSALSRRTSSSSALILACSEGLLVDAAACIACSHEAETVPSTDTEGGSASVPAGADCCSQSAVAAPCASSMASGGGGGSPAPASGPPASPLIRRIRPAAGTEPRSQYQFPPLLPSPS